MSAESPSPDNNDDSPWSPDSLVRDRGVSKGIRSIKSGSRKAREGTTEAIRGLVILIIALLALRNEEDEDRERDLLAGAGFWSDEEANRVREGRRKAKEKSKERMRRLTENADESG